MPPRGRYLAREVGRLAGVSGDRIGQWARRGYIQSSQSSTVPRVYSYQDVAEAMVVHELIRNKVPLSSIRQTILNVRETHGSWPLTMVDISVAVDPTDRREVFVHERGGMYDAAKKGRPGVLELVDLKRIVGDLQRGGWAVRELPDLRHIEVHPDRLSGRPAIRGRRIAADEVAEMATTKSGLTLLREDYDLSDEEIDDARRWWAAVQRFDAAA